jgi:hypothetical protein
MTSHPASGDYPLWLASQIRGEEDGHPGRTYDGLVTIMYETEFLWFVPNDDNRKADGLDLRLEFCYEKNISKQEAGAFLDKGVPIPPCSFLEVLIGLSRRLEFAAGGSPERWAWILMHNLDLHRITDPVGRGKARRAKDILQTCIHRNYEPNGVGGFFPLPESAAEDQRQVELWYQMAAYIDEMPRERR